MLLEINSKILHKALVVASKIAAKKTGIEATSSILIEATDTYLNIKATNFEVSLCAKLACSISKTGAVLIEARKLTALVGTYKDTDIILKSDKNGGLHLTYGESKHKLAGSPVDNFPKTESEGKVPFSMGSKDFAQMMRRTVYLVENNEEKPHLSGIGLIVDKNCLSLISTDTKRIVRTRFYQKNDFLINAQCTVPSLALAEVTSILTESELLEFGISEGRCSFKCGNYYLAATTFTQKFPDVSAMFLQGTKIEINRAELLGSLSRTIILADKQSPVNEFVFEKTRLLIKSEDGESSSGEVLDIKTDTEFTCAFQAKHITQFLNTISGDTVYFVCDEKKSRFNLTEPGSLYNTEYVLFPIHSR